MGQQKIDYDLKWRIWRSTSIGWDGLFLIFISPIFISLFKKLDLAFAYWSYLITFILLILFMLFGPTREEEYKRKLNILKGGSE